MLKIQQATSLDLKAICELNQELVRQDLAQISNFMWSREGWIKKEIKAGNFYIANDKNMILGAICLKITDGELFLETIAVTSVKQKTGLGKQLIAFAIEKARKLKKPRLHVESFTNYNLKEFYEKCGFKLNEPNIKFFEGVPYYCFVMDI